MLLPEIQILVCIIVKMKKSIILLFLMDVVVKYLLHKVSYTPSIFKCFLTSNLTYVMLLLLPGSLLVNEYLTLVLLLPHKTPCLHVFFFFLLSSPYMTRVVIKRMGLASNNYRLWRWWYFCICSDKTHGSPLNFFHWTDQYLRWFGQNLPQIIIGFIYPWKGVKCSCYF